MPASRTILAFDWGLRCIGVALGQQLIHSSTPLTILKATNGAPDWQAIERLVREWQPDLLVVGLPLNMDGSDSVSSDHARRFARRLQGRLNLPVTLVDERLTSHEARQQRREREDYRDNRQHTVDAEAACIILQDYYNRLPDGAEKA